MDGGLLWKCSLLGLAWSVPPFLVLANRDYSLDPKLAYNIMLSIPVLAFASLLPPAPEEPGGSATKWAYRVAFWLGILTGLGSLVLIFVTSLLLAGLG